MSDRATSSQHSTNPGLSLAAGAATALACGFHVRQFFFLSDDAYISFRYAGHWARGLGLVWNPGEAVEGYSNFLWVAIVTAGMKLGINPESLAPALGIASGAAILGLVAALGARRYGWSDPLIWAAPGALALHRSFCGWATSGLETLFFSLLVLSGYLILERELRQKRAVPWRSALVLALASLTRADGGLFAFWAGLCFLGSTAANRRQIRSLLSWTLIYSVVVGAHLLWRYDYYGFWLPNTFYAKVSPFSANPGMVYFKHFTLGFGLPLFAPLAAFAVVRARDFRSSLFGTAIVGHCIYLFYIGGDFLEYRFIVPILPLAFWLVVEGARGLPALFANSAWSAAVQWIAIGALLLSTLLGTHSRQATELGGGLESIARTRTYGEMRAEQGRRLKGLIERGVLSPDLRIQTGGAGALPYYTDWYTLDKRGLNDLEIARASTGLHHRPGHQRHASFRYTHDKRLDVVIVGHRLLFWEHPVWLRKALDDARVWASKANRKLEIRDAFRPVCVEVEPGSHMVFATPLAPDALRQRFGSFAECDFNELPDAEPQGAEPSASREASRPSPAAEHKAR